MMMISGFLYSASLAAARLVAQLQPHDHVTPTMCALHWLSVEYHIIYKLCLLMHHIHNGETPVYLADIVTATSDTESPSGLRSPSSGRYEISRSPPPTRRTPIRRCWSNSLEQSTCTPPSDQIYCNNNSNNHISIAPYASYRGAVTLKRPLKSVLFQ